MSGIRNDEERTAYPCWAEGTSLEGFKHLLPKPIVDKNTVLHSETELQPAAPPVPVIHSETEVPPAAPLVPVVPTKTTVPTPLPAVPMQKAMLVSTTTNDAPKTSGVAKCDDPLRVVQKYKAYFRIESQKYQEGLRPKPPTFKATMPATWLESFLISGSYKKPTGETWTYEKIDDEELF